MEPAQVAESELLDETLEARARELLGGNGSELEQLTILATLRARGAPSSLRWHEFAVRHGRASSDAAGVGLAEIALTSLRADAAHDDGARAALERLAFASPELALGLRRRAASTFATHADAAGRARLEYALARESDATLIEGCRVALAEREPETPGRASE